MNHFKLVMHGIQTPPGEVYGYTEAGNGELGFYIVSDGSMRPWRCHARGPDVRVSPPEPSGMFVMPAANREHRFVHPDVPPLTKQLQPSIFNLRVPLPERNEVFLMNTLTDAQLVVSPDVAALLDRVVALDGRPTDSPSFNGDEIDALQVLTDNGFLVRRSPGRSAPARPVLRPRHQRAPTSCTSRC